MNDINIIDKKYMKLALELAKKGRGRVNPNPMVGAIIVKDGDIVGRGYHKYFGGCHAEVNALKMAGDNAKGSDIYVSLEPCSHYGKTPPCANALVNAGIKRAIVAMTDPNPLVSGKGIEILKKNEIEVKVGVLEDEAKKLNEIFIKYITQKLPFVIMKTASTLDGKIATFSGKSRWISCDSSREYAHNLRNNIMAVMVGIGTVITDDPLLTTRLSGKQTRDPIAVIVDSKLRIPMNSKVLSTALKRKVIIASCKNVDKDKKDELKKMGIDVIETPPMDGKVDLRYLMRKLGYMGIDSILLEGGGTLNFSCLKEGIVDKVVSFISPKIIGGKDAKTSVEGDGVSEISESFKICNMDVKRIGEDTLIEGYMKKRE